MQKKIVILLAVAIAVVVVVVLWIVNRGGDGTGSRGTIRIGAIDPLTGPMAAYGEPVRDGMILAVEEINAQGGINGRKIELLLEDDGGDPKNAVNAFTKLATVSKVPVIIGPLSSGCSMATAPLAE
jgi:branched-chain amino acid transport system substrate-binding protein